MCISLSLSLSLYIYIYIKRERESCGRPPAELVREVAAVVAQDVVLLHPPLLRVFERERER